MQQPEDIQKTALKETMARGRRLVKSFSDHPEKFTEEQAKGIYRVAKQYNIPIDSYPELTGGKKQSGIGRAFGTGAWQQAKKAGIMKTAGVMGASALDELILDLVPDHWYSSKDTDQIRKATKVGTFAASMLIPGLNAIKAAKGASTSAKAAALTAKGVSYGKKGKDLLSIATKTTKALDKIKTATDVAKSVDAATDAVNVAMKAYQKIRASGNVLGTAAAYEKLAKAKKALTLANKMKITSARSITTLTNKANKAKMALDTFEATKKAKHLSKIAALEKEATALSHINRVRKGMEYTPGGVAGKGLLKLLGAGGEKVIKEGAEEIAKKTLTEQVKNLLQMGLSSIPNVASSTALGIQAGHGVQNLMGMNEVDYVGNVNYAPIPIYGGSMPRPGSYAPLPQMKQ